MSGLFGSSKTSQQKSDKAQRRADRIQLKADAYKGTGKEAKAQGRADSAQEEADRYYQNIPGNENKERDIGPSEDYTGIAVGKSLTKTGTQARLTRHRRMLRPRSGKLGPARTALS